MQIISFFRGLKNYIKKPTLSLKAWEKIDKAIQTNLLFWVFMTIFNLPYMSQIYYAHAIHETNGILQGIILCGGFCSIFAVVFLLSVLLLNLPAFFRQITMWLSGFFFIVDSFSVWKYHSLFDEAMMQSVVATNPQEAQEFLLQFVQTEYLLLLTGTFGILALCFSYRKYLQQACLRRKKLLCYTFLGSYAVFTLMSFDIHGSAVLPRENSLLRFLSIVPITYADMHSYKEMQETFGKKPVHLTENQGDIPYVVLVLGESASKHHMSLYGYGLPTTPKMDSMQQEGSLVAFTDTISPDSYTIAVLKKLFNFSRWEDEDSIPWYNQQDLFTILQAAGYRTHWLSNQESSGIWGNIAKIYAEHCTDHQFTAVRTSKNYAVPYDEALLPLLDQTLRNVPGTPREFMVLHLMGCHDLYENRTPAAFKQFTEAQEEGNQGYVRQTRADYDNAILYNDWLLGEIIQRFQDKNAIIIYLSDHGEAVFDQGSVECGHKAKGSFGLLEIPMTFWASSKFKSEYPDIWQQILIAKDRPYMTDDLIYGLMDLMQIKTDGYHEDRSVFSPSFDATRERRYNGDVYVI